MSEQNGLQVAEDISKCIFASDRYCILIHILLKFVPNVSINKISTLVQKMAWREISAGQLIDPILTTITDAIDVVLLGHNELQTQHRGAKP